MSNKTIKKKGPKPDLKKQKYWQQKIVAWRKSNLSRKDFCLKYELNVNTFDYYRYKLKLDDEVTPRDKSIIENKKRLQREESGYKIEKLFLKDLKEKDQELVHKYIKYLALGGKSKNTINNYRHCITRFIKYYENDDVTTFDTDQINEYIHDLLSVEHSHTYINHVISAIYHLYKNVLKSEDVDFEGVQRLKEKKGLPRVLSREEVLRVINVSKHNIKWLTWYSLIYSTGMRIDELVKLKKEDILSNEGLVLVREGKGKKDRYTLLSPHVLKLLRRYWSEDPLDKTFWLFPSPMDFKEHIRAGTVSTTFKMIKNDAGIKRVVTCHGLRHSFATHMLDDGADIRVIQQLMGHVDIKTTVIYLSVSKKMLKKYPSPIDFYFKK